MRKFLFIFLIVCYNLQGVEYLSEDSEYIDVYFEKLEEGGYTFYADNRHFIPQFINLRFPTLKNMELVEGTDSGVVLQPGEESILIATILPKKKNASYSFRSRLSYTNGDPLNVTPDDFSYLFPYAHGAKYKIDQGFGGKFTHQDENFYALDFSMDIGTPVHAAREGVVIEVKEDSNRGGRSASYGNDANYILIYHSDGTFASYVHLKQNGAEVEVGDRVKQGEFIGYSGNTGFSSGPHLHFSVNVPTIKGVRQSIPMKMVNHLGEVVTPEVGEYYYAKHPDGEIFEAVFGDDLTNEDYKNYQVSIPKSDTLSFRDESIDSTTVIYCRNGYDSEIETTFTFRLQNAKTSMDTPIDMIIPPLSEVFVCLVNPVNPGKASGFTYSASYYLLE